MLKLFALILLLLGTRVHADLPDNYYAEMEINNVGFTPDFVEMNIPTSTDPKPEINLKDITKRAIGQTLEGHLITLVNPLGHWHIFPSPSGCPGKETTGANAGLLLIQSSVPHCTLAFFFAPCCDSEALVCGGH